MIEFEKAIKSGKARFLTVDILPTFDKRLLNPVCVPTADRLKYSWGSLGGKNEI